LGFVVVSGELSARRGVRTKNSGEKQSAAAAQHTAMHEQSNWSHLPRRQLFRHLGELNDACRLAVAHLERH